MTDYTKTTDFAAKDALTTGNANKVVSGAELDDEFNNLSTAIITKYDSDDRGAVSGIAPLDASQLVPAANLPAATESAIGAVELATTAEVVAGTDTARAVTAAGIKAVLDNNAGLLNDIFNLVDPNADRLLFWDESANGTTFLTPSTGITITGFNLTTDDSAIVHDNLSGFVADEHIAHSGVTLTAGDGLSGGGTIAASRSFAVDSTVIRTSGNFSMSGGLTVGGDFATGGSFATTAVTTNSGTGILSNVSIGTTGILSLTGASSVTLTGIAGGSSGRRVVIFNNTGTTLAVTHNSTSTAANRIYNANSIQKSVPTFGSIELVYDSSVSRWRHLDHNAAAS